MLQTVPKLTVSGLCSFFFFFFFIFFFVVVVLVVVAARLTDRFLFMNEMLYEIFSLPSASKMNVANCQVPTDLLTSDLGI